jgi:hypothetical protein
MVRVEEELRHQRELMREGFAQMDTRFEAMQKTMDQRFGVMQTSMNQRFEQIDKRFEQVDIANRALVPEARGRRGICDGGNVREGVAYPVPRVQLSPNPAESPQRQQH